MSLIVTVLVSTLVSALVALGIEYTAKPQLEARKEQLLEAYRRRRELLGQLDTISVIAGAWSELPAGERDRQWQRLAAMTETMFDNAWLYAASYRRVFRQFGRPSAFELIGSYIYTIRGIFLGDRSQAEVVGALGELTGPLSALLSAGWRVRTRIGAPSLMSAMLAKHTGRDPESTAASLSAPSVGAHRSARSGAQSSNVG